MCKVSALFLYNGLNARGRESQCSITIRDSVKEERILEALTNLNFHYKGNIFKYIGDEYDLYLKEYKNIIHSLRLFLIIFLKNYPKIKLSLCI